MSRKYNPEWCARGVYQRQVVREMTSTGAERPTRGKVLRGKARGYASRYEESFTNLVKRLRASGFEVNEYMGRYYIESD